MYSLANETVKVSTTYRDFIVNILNYLSTRTLWANTSMVDSLVNLPSKKVVHRAEISGVKSSIEVGKHKPHASHSVNIVFGARFRLICPEEFSMIYNHPQQGGARGLSKPILTSVNGPMV